MPKVKSKTVTERDARTIAQWWKRARACNCAADLREFLQPFMDGTIVYDYGTVAIATAVCAFAAANTMARVQGITGAQAGFAFWEFTRAWRVPNVKVGLRLLNFDEMLYPQNQSEFMAIPAETFQRLRREARRLLAIPGAGLHPAARVKAHWKRIAGGAVPFGYRVET